jgi:hypothetical protein
MCETETLSVDKVWLAEQSLSTDSKIRAISSEKLATQELA